MTSQARPGGGEDPLLLTACAGGIATVTLNDPRRRNALSRSMLLALRTALAAFGEDPAVRAVVVAAEGAVFSSGHDMRELTGAGAAETAALFALSCGVMEQIRLLPQPVIARVQGLASAAGCQLVASCDLAVASSAAAFQTPGLKIGLFCSTPAVPLARAVPTKKAMEMLLTGEPIAPEAALAAGLINRVVPPQSLAAETEALARQIIQYSGAAIALGKRAFYRQLPLDIPGAYGVANPAMTENALHEDAQEGMNAFLQKRPPVWRH